MARPLTWAETLATLPAAALASPKAHAAIAVLLGATLASTVSRTLSAFQQTIAIKLLDSLLAAAVAIESDLAVGQTESTAHITWRTVDLPAIAAIVATVCPAASAALPLALRVTLALSDPASLAPGGAALLAAISVPSQPARDAAFQHASAALRIFFA